MASKKILIPVSFLILAILACNFATAGQTQPGTTTPELPLLTTSETNLSESQASDSTPEDTTAGSAENPVVTTEVPSPTFTTIATETPTSSPTITPTEIPCNQARFVSDVTIPDGTKLSPNENFKKTWRLKNTGSCTWTSGYAIVFINGDAMNAPGAVQITNGTVAPGNEVDVSVNLKAPANAGTYRGNWKLRDGANTIFGVKNSDQGYFWVEIQVKAAAQPTIPDWPLVKKGDQGAEVHAIQHLLRAHGYSLTVDGIFGNKTRAEVQAFQAAKGLSADGIVGAKTWNALISGKTVQNGSSGEAVFAVQRLLHKFGYTLTIDGKFGPITTQAVKDFQQKYGLKVDGIVGPETWKALVSLP